MNSTDKDIIISSPRISLVKPNLSYLDEFIDKVRCSKHIHTPWVQPPAHNDDFVAYLNRQQKDATVSFFILSNHSHELVGVININEIVRGIFCSGYLGYYGFSGFEKQGMMTEGLKLVINYAFNYLHLHRLEANIQPGNIRSLLLAHRCGFIKEGYSKNYLYLNGKWRDHIRYTITKERFDTVSPQPIPSLEIRPIEQSDFNPLSESFYKAGLNKPIDIFKRYYEQQMNNQRMVWVAILDGQFAGYGTLVWHSLYQPFAEQNIPEIKDLNVLPQFRNQDIGTALIVMAENCAFQHTTQIGVGAGLYQDYGVAQKLYYSLGYIPDGNGMTYEYKPAKPGSTFKLDDEACLWFVKSL